MSCLLLVAGCGGEGSNPAGPPTVTPIYAGTWTGTYLVSSCTNTGFFADASFCASVLNTSAPVTFTFTQTDRAVTGSFRLGSLSFPDLTASVGTDGSLALASSLQDGLFTIDATWTLQQRTGGTLTGQTRQTWKGMGLSGEGTLQGQIDSVTKTSALVSVLPSEGPAHTTLRDLLAAIRAARSP